MSKQSEAKAAQCYRRELDKCENCEHFKFDVHEEKSTWSDQIWRTEKNLRCEIGGFKVHKTAVCDRFERKDQP
jgi:hypothetical protein